jgi:hypothetical protein
MKIFFAEGLHRQAAKSGKSLRGSSAHERSGMRDRRKDPDIAELTRVTCSRTTPTSQKTSYSAKAEYPVITAVNEMHRSGILDYPVKPDDDAGNWRDGALANRPPLQCLTPPALRPASPSQDRETSRRGFRSCGTGRTRRRPATAARPDRRSPMLRRRARRWRLRRRA